MRWVTASKKPHEADESAEEPNAAVQEEVVGLPPSQLQTRPIIHAQDLFEVHMTVADLDRAIAFYRDALGLKLAHIMSERQAALFWIGAAGNAMLGLWAAGSGPQRVALHTAFRASLADVIAAPRALRSAGITPLDFDGRPTDQPVVLAWMPAASIFFRDPDGHLLEYIAMLPHEPRPEYGIVPWRMWELMRGAPPMADALQTR